MSAEAGSDSRGQGLAGAAERVPPYVRRFTRRPLRWTARAALDARDALRGERDPLVPPRRLGMPSQGPTVGARIVEQLLIGAAGLKPDERVVDIGCGAGRVAANLTTYLEPPEGSYEGFDVSERAIEWAHTQITPRHPSFRFQLVDVRNDEYSPGAGGDAASFRFPFRDEDFDLTVATSLYTHMFPFQIVNYLTETVRVLRPGGRSLATFFLLNEESEAAIAKGVRLPLGAGGGLLELSADLDDGHGGRYRTRDPRRPEARIVLHEEDVVALYERAGLTIREIRYGRWVGPRKGGGEHAQDVIVAER
jgi:SAM-dependent methyltransferase